MHLLSLGKTVLGTLTQHWRVTLTVLALSAVVGGGFWIKAELDEAYRARARAELALDSLEAVKDTTRLLQVQAYGRIVDVYQRRAIQTENLNTELSDSLDIVTRANTTLKLQVQSLQATGIEGTTDQVEDSTETVARVTFEFYREPFAVWAEVLMQDPPLLNINITPDPVLLDLYVGCRATPDGVQPAYVDVSVPNFTRTEILRARFHPDVCNPGILEPPGLWDRIQPKAKKVGMFAGAGIVLFELGHLVVTGEFWHPF